MTKSKQEDSSIKNVVIIMIVLIVFFGVGYFIGTKLISEPEEVVTHEEVEYELDDPMIVKLINDLVAGYPCSYLEVYTNDKTVTSEDIPNELLYRVGEESFDSSDKKSITIKDFKSELNKHFSVGYSFEPDTIDYNGAGCYKYRFDSISQEYVKKDISCEDSCSPNGTQYIITRAVGKDLDLKVYVKVLFGSNDESIKFYSDYERKKYLTDDYDKIEKYYYKGSEYEFIFQKVDDNYLFVSSERI